ncbi:MAG: DUF4139 domain-containing protein [Planctomycetaceae bacterium]|nr:DUF4139 domain-containing protein [Planctomycetaceae bacterium]
MIRPLPLSLAALLVTTALHAAPPQDPDVSLTVYSSADPRGFDPQQFIAQQRAGYNPNFASQVPGFGVIRDTRTISLKPDVNTVRFTDVAAFIDPTTVSFADVSPHARNAKPDKLPSIIEQSFQFDLVSPEKLLNKYIDRSITARILLADGGHEDVTGSLLSNTQGQLVIQTGAGLRILQRSQVQLKLADLPGGLITRPTLEWLVQSPDDAPRDHRIRTTYQTGGITWRADYNLLLNQDDTKADISAWVSLMNLSGIAYENAKLKLIAGDVQRVPSAGQYDRRRMEKSMMMAAESAAFEEKEFFEYHLYTLPRRTTVRNNATQQIALFPAVPDVNVDKVLLYNGLPDAAHWSIARNPHLDKNFGNQSNKKVDVYIRLDNSEEDGLGKPLPKGKVRVYKRDDADDSLEFVGEDLIDHTAKGAQILIRVGNAFDVTGERTQTDFSIDKRGHVITESYRIKLNNAKDNPVNVVVKEFLYRWHNWRITRQSDDFKKIDSRTIDFEVQVPAESSRQIEYTVRYTW